VWSLPFRLSNQKFVRIYYIPHARYMPRPSHPPWFDRPIIFGENKLLCSFLQPPVTTSLLGVLVTLFSKPSVCSSFYMRDQVSHSYKTTDKITVLYILIVRFSIAD
jgi:hypothetical protein